MKQVVKLKNKKNCIMNFHPQLFWFWNSDYLVRCTPFDSGKTTATYIGFHNEYKSNIRYKLFLAIIVFERHMCLGILNIFLIGNRWTYSIPSTAYPFLVSYSKTRSLCRESTTLRRPYLLYIYHCYSYKRPEMTLGRSLAISLLLWIM
jgi:hypothetical protein